MDRFRSVILVLCLVSEIILPVTGMNLRNLTIPESEIRFGYGLLYQYHGKIIHGLNRYDMIVGLKLPDLRISDYYIPQPFEPNFCERFNDENTQTLYTTCRNVWPAYLTNIEKIKYMQKQVNRIITEDIPAILPGFKPEDLGYNPMLQPEFINDPKVPLGPQSEISENLGETTHWDQKTEESWHHRAKRWISDLISLGIQGISAFVNWRKESNIKKGMRMLMKNQKKMGDKIVSMDHEMMSLAKTTNKQLDELRQEVMAQGIALRYAINSLKKSIKINQLRIHDNSQAITFLSGSIYVMLTKTNRYIDILRQVETELDHFLDALDNLAKGYLSHTVIRPGVLQGLLKHVEEQIMRHYPEYECIMAEDEFYYKLPLIIHSYEKGVIGIQIPVFVKPKLQEPLDAFQIKSVAVPYHINRDLIDSSEESAYTYTKLVPSSELMAISGDTNIKLDLMDLERCHKIDDTYLCEPLMLMTHRSVHTCESAIYHRQSPELIKSLCNIQYGKTEHLEEALLDAGNYFLLANLPLPWTVFCKHTDQIPATLKGASYAIVQKSDLCGCEIKAGEHYVQDNIKHCTRDMNADIDLYYPINYMAMMYQAMDKITEGNVDDTSMFLKPYPWDPVEPNVIEVIESDKVEYQPYSVSFAKAMEDPSKPLYASHEAYSLSLQDPSSYFEGNGIMGFLLITGCIAIGLAILLIPQVLKLCGMGQKVQGLSSTVGVMVSILQNLGFLKKDTMLHAQSIGNRAQAPREPVIQISMSSLPEMLLVLFKTVVIVLTICMMLVVLYKSIKFIYQYYTATNLSTLQVSNGLWKFLVFDKTDLYVQVDCNKYKYSLDLLIGYTYGNPEAIVVDGQHEPGDLKLSKQRLNDCMFVSWRYCSLIMDEVYLAMPHSIQISLWHKFYLRHILGHKETKFRIIAYNRTSKKVRPLTLWTLVQGPLGSVAILNNQTNPIYNEDPLQLNEMVVNRIQDSPSETHSSLDAVEAQQSAILHVEEELEQEDEELSVQHQIEDPNVDSVVHPKPEKPPRDKTRKFIRQNCQGCNKYIPQASSSTSMIVWCKNCKKE